MTTILDEVNPEVPLEKKTEREYKDRPIWVKAELHKRFNAVCKEKGYKMTWVTNELLGKWVSVEEAKKRSLDGAE